MFRRAGLLYLLIVVTIVLSALAQSAPSIPSSTPTMPAQAKLPQSKQKAVPTIKANAQLVVVDVVVTDRRHRPVRGLRAADFMVSEGKSPQTVLDFEEHTALNASDATQFAAMPKLPPGVFTNYTPTPVNGAVDVLLLDSLNTPMANQPYVRQQLLAYMKSTPPGTRIAIFGLSTHLVLLQGFTSDPDTLKNILTKATGKGSPLLDDPLGGGGTSNSEADDLEDKNPTNAEMAVVIENLREFEARHESFELQLRARYTLDAMNTIAHYLAAIPGRKNLIWLSGSFPINVTPDTNIPMDASTPPTPGTPAGPDILHNPFVAVANSEDEFRETTALFARSQVAVYPIDARGLTVSSEYLASSSRNYSGGFAGQLRLQRDHDKYLNETNEEHGTMREMAAATGGRAFVNTNGLAWAVATAIEDGSNFYTLTYTPTNSNRDGKLRNIKVRLAQPGFDLAYRQGYHADGPDKGKDASAVAMDAALMSASSVSRQATEQRAMMRGAPTPAEILFKVGVAPIGPKTETEDTPAPGNTPAAKTRGPYLRYGVNYAIDPAGLSFLRTPEGQIHADFDLIVFVFDRDGVLINSQDSRVAIRATPDQVRQLVAKGYNRHVEISVPAKGEYFFRIAVHDPLRDHYGAVEIATSQVRNVVPPSVAPLIPAAPTTQ